MCFRLAKRCLVYGQTTLLDSLKTKRNKKLAKRSEGANMMTINERRRQPTTGQNKDKHIGKFFSHKGINNMHDLSCTWNTVCSHITYTVVTMHAICEGLIMTNFWWQTKYFAINAFRAAFPFLCFVCLCFFATMKHTVFNSEFFLPGYFFMSSALYPGFSNPSALSSTLTALLLFTFALSFL